MSRYSFRETNPRYYRVMRLASLLERAALLAERALGDGKRDRYLSLCKRRRVFFAALADFAVHLDNDIFVPAPASNRKSQIANRKSAHAEGACR